MRFLLLAVVPAAICVAVANCSGGSDGDAAHATVEKFCAELTAPFCEADWSCCLAPGSHLGQSVEDCKQRFTTYNDMLEMCNPIGVGDKGDLEASLRAGTTVFDQAQFDECVTVLKSMAGGGAACVEPPGAVVRRACLGAFRGQLDAGAHCDWQDKLFQDSFTQCKDGRCETNRCVPFLKLGDACQNSVEWAKPAFTMCNYAQNETCWPWPNEGDDAGTCVPMHALGDPCDNTAIDTDYQCKSWNCDQDAGNCAVADPYAKACDYSSP